MTPEEQRIIAAIPASESVRHLLSLTPEQQRDAFGQMSPEARKQLVAEALAGVGNIVRDVLATDPDQLWKDERARCDQALKLN